MSNRPASKQNNKHSSRVTTTLSARGMGRLLIVPILAALKPKAARWLADWSSRNTTGFLAWVSSAVGGGAAANEQWGAAIVAGVVAVSLFLLELAASWALNATAAGKDEDEEEVIPRALPVEPDAPTVHRVKASPEPRGRDGWTMLQTIGFLSMLLVVLSITFMMTSCSSNTVTRAKEFSGEALERVSGVASVKYQAGELCLCLGVRDLFGGDGERVETDRQGGPLREVPLTLHSVPSK